MRFVQSEIGSQYSVSSDEKDQLTNWLDMVLVASNAEDLTGQVFVANFVDDDKVQQTPAGSVVAITQRMPLSGGSSPDNLTDVVIEHDEIWEGNAQAGIFFDVATPELDNSVATYTMELRHDEFTHERYSNRMFVKATLPNPESSNYTLEIEPWLRQSVKPNRLGFDVIRYTILDEADAIGVEMISDPTDVIHGRARFRPLDQHDAELYSLLGHVQFVSTVLGVEVPECLRTP